MPPYFWIRNGCPSIISELMNDVKKKLLIFGESAIELKALEQYATIVPDMVANYEIVGISEYDQPISAATYLSADIVLFSLFRRYGVRQRAEGIPSLEQRLRRGKLGLLYDFCIPDVKDNPLVWDIAENVTLAEKLSYLTTTNLDFMAYLEPLKQVFAEHLFTVDGHL